MPRLLATPSQAPRRRRRLCEPAFALVACLLLAVTATGAAAIQPPQHDLIDRPISAVRIAGLQRVQETLVRHNIRTVVGDPYDPEIVRGDVARLYELGVFAHITAEAELRPDGTVHVIITVVEQPLVLEVQVVGNTLVPDAMIRGAIPITRGMARDEFLIERSKRAIESLYRERGHYLTTVTIDETELAATGVLIFRILEGPRVRIRAIRFEGNEHFEDRQLHAQIKTRTALFLLRRGQLDEEQLRDDVAALHRYYRDRGYLDVRADYQIDLSPDNREAMVTFHIAEGMPYTLRSVRVARPLEVFAPEQIAAMLEIRAGDVYSGDRIRRSIEHVEDAYGRLGRVDVRVEVAEPIRVGPEPEVDLVLDIIEGASATVGLVHIQGNFLTRDRVVRRQVRLFPGRPLDATEVERSERRLRDTRLFNDARITVLDPLEPPAPGEPDLRDVLVEIKERNTGAVNFGVAFGTDTGVFGEFSITQNNFDLFDLPRSVEELYTGRAFRGAGQQFHMVLRPGSEFFQYSVSLVEPHLFETDFSLRTAFSFGQREFRRFDEERISGTFGFGRAFGDFWDIGLRGRVEQVELRRIEPFAPTELFADAGPNLLTTLGVALTRTTIPPISRPGRGTRFQVAYDRAGAMTGDFDFNVFTSDFTLFLTVDEDFLGRKSTLRLNTEVGYIFGGRAPTYERFYRGGRSFRGFRFREISPKGVRADTLGPSVDPVGGSWMFYTGAQYEHPLFGEMVTGVVFVDSGTVTESVSFADYRVSAGVGVRLYIPQLGPVPIAFDFGFPLKKHPADRKQLISFSAELPF
jgi:outer membrane protein insertion porin family